MALINTDRAAGCDRPHDRMADLTFHNFVNRAADCATTFTLAVFYNAFPVDPYTVAFFCFPDRLANRVAAITFAGLPDRLADGVLFFAV